MYRKMRLEAYLQYKLRRNVTAIEVAEAAGVSRNTFGPHSRKGTLSLDTIEKVLDHYQAEANGLGESLNLTDALVEMHYLPAPTQDFSHAPTTTATRTGQQTQAPTKRDLTEYGG